MWFERFNLAVLKWGRRGTRRRIAACTTEHGFEKLEEDAASSL